MSGLTFGANASGPRMGVYACECGWMYHSWNRRLYCTALYNDRLCGKRLTCWIEPVPVGAS
jgi:hypothetical protein